MKYTLILSLIVLSSSVFAGVMPNKSRIIYNEKSTSESIMLVNTNDYPVMVQLWTDEGAVNSTPEQANAPFVATPTMFKLNAKQLNGIKVMYSGEKNQLAKEKESLFWLNIFEVPPQAPDEDGEKKIALSILTQMKIIYRPETLKKTSMEVTEALSQITFSLDSSQSDVLYLTVNNPTPYIANFAMMSLKGFAHSKPISLSVNQELDLTVLPQSSQTFRFNTLAQSALNINLIEYTLVNDDGAYIVMAHPL